MEIGSIYEINPESVADTGVDNASEFRLGEVEKYGKKYGKFTASGREAIALALKSMEKNRPSLKKRCLLPAYMCDTVFFPFERAGWEIYFYHMEKNLEAEEENLCEQIKNIRPDLLFVHPYYGVDTWKPMRSLFKEWRARGICIMEDVTQSYYLKDAGRGADYVVGSLRKWYPIPDGGFVVSDERLPEEELTVNEEFTEKRMELLTEKWKYLHGEGDSEEKKELKADFLKKNREMEEWLDDHDGVGALSKEAIRILSAVDEGECRDRRNANYRYLYERLGGKTQFMPILLEKESCSAIEDQSDVCTAPLYFAVYVRDRDDLQKFLVEKDVYAPMLWPIGKENESCLTWKERYIYEHMLALPMDQRYGEKEMRRVADVLEEYERMRNGDLKREGSLEREAEIIAIRADANDTVATGHIMRCITIAKRLRAKGKKVMFFTADEYAHAMLEQAGMEYVCLHTSWNRMEEEVTVLRRELEKAGCNKLLVDSYQATAGYFDKLKDICKLIYIDDCFDAVYPADMIINYNAYHVRFPYEQVYEGKAKLLLGTAYVPLREEFQKPSFMNGSMEKKENNEWHVLLSSGGGDVYNALSAILCEAIAEEENSQIIFHAVVGRFNKNVEELEQLSESHSNIKLHYNVSDMAALMRQCDAAISAAGTMLFELCAMQIPTIFFVCADNQQYDSDFFAKEERMLFAGDIRVNRKECLEEIVRSMKNLLRDKEMRQKMKRKLHEVTDGGGADRIAEEIIKL